MLWHISVLQLKSSSSVLLLYCLVTRFFFEEIYRKCRVLLHFRFSPLWVFWMHNVFQELTASMVVQGFLASSCKTKPSNCKFTCPFLVHVAPV